MNRISQKTVGILGFGKTGQSLLKFIAPLYSRCIVFEPAEPTIEQQQLINAFNATLVKRNCTQEDCTTIDYIIPSPGIPIDHLIKNHSNKLISELDLFASACTTKTIAVTGSAGKTTVVTLLTELLNRSGYKARSLGNIGTPLLDGIATQAEYDFFVVELSSFQLELSHSFAPTIGVITNLFPNHLDRHGSMSAYARAKAQLFAFQTNDQITILPEAFVSLFAPYAADKPLLVLQQDTYTNFISTAMQQLTFKDNWNIIFAVLEKIGIPATSISNQSLNLTIPEHRCEFLGTKKGITFYNDSKATISEATLATVTALSNQSNSPLILLLGGISKGVNREPLIAALPEQVKLIICFGKEAEQLRQICEKHEKATLCCATLEDAWQAALTHTLSGDTILLSPAGASYDLFTNYEQRGNRFKSLVQSFS